MLSDSALYRQPNGRKLENEFLPPPSLDFLPGFSLAKLNWKPQARESLSSTIHKDQPPKTERKVEKVDQGGDGYKWEAVWVAEGPRGWVTAFKTTAL